MFVKITNGQIEKCPYSIGEFRKDNPQTSFPKDIPASTLEAHGVFVVVDTTPPEIDRKKQTYTWSVELVNGRWTQIWSVVQLPEDRAVANMRAERDRLLSASDWTQVLDAPVDRTAWATYRQALRDLPNAEGFPDVEFPLSPDSVTGE